MTLHIEGGAKRILHGASWVRIPLVNLRARRHGILGIWEALRRQTCKFACLGFGTSWRRAQWLFASCGSAVTRA